MNNIYVKEIVRFLVFVAIVLIPITLVVRSGSRSNVLQFAVLAISIVVATVIDQRLK